jgi:putative tryptophan/tyrosine transport system substrate-binding protein
MRRREVIAGVGVFAAVWPSAMLAQQAPRVRRIGLLVGLSADDPGMKPRLAALDKELERLGWLEGRTVRIDRRYAPGGAGAEELAKELVALQPDVILGHTVSVTAALQRHTRAIPIVFVSVGDPLGAGFIGNLARPDGNLTGFMTFEAGISGNGSLCSKRSCPVLPGRCL